MSPSKPASLLCIGTLFCLILSLSIAAPILIRPFYYIQIRTLHLSEQTGWSEEVIRDAYDEVLDYCVFGKPFGTGQLAWSESGKSHFEDVRGLFLTDFAVLGASACLTGILYWLNRTGRLRFYRFLGRGVGFWAGVSTLVLTAAIGALAAVNFDRAFVVFHALFFPGKDNWIFDPSTDQIILVMPEVFFRNCALFIAAVLILCCVILILHDRRHRRSAAVSY